MKLHLLIALAAALFLSGTAHADPTAAPPPLGPSAQTPVPPPAPANASQPPAPAARREEDPGNAAPPVNLSILQRVAAFATGRTRAAENNTSLQSQIQTLTQTLSARDATIAQLTAQLAEKTGMLQEIGNWIVENGHCDPAAAAANPAAAFGNAVSTGVAAAVRSIGVPLAAVPSPAADGTRKTHAELEEELAKCKTTREKQDFLAKHRDIIFAN